jgi:ATP-dependent 26S proteasome regulatory subunit
MVACSSLPSLDDALVRPGRLSHHLHIPNPTQEDILAILNYKLDPITIHGNCNLGSVAEELTLWNPSCADVDFIFKETVMDAMRSIIDNHNDHENQDELSYLISKDNFDRALRARYGEKIFPIRSSTMNNSFKFKISDNGFNFT